jgi:hypothetical protein
MRENFEVRIESETLFPKFIKTDLSLRSVAEIFEMQKGSRRQQWPDVVDGLGEVVRQKILEPLQIDDEECEFDMKDFDFIEKEILGKEIDEIGALAEIVIDGAMERVSQESSKDSFPLSEWVENLIVSPLYTPTVDENPDTYYLAVRRAAEILTVAALDDMSGSNGVLKLAYVAGGLRRESKLGEIVRDLSYELYERAVESSNPVAQLTARSIRKKLECSILSPAIRNEIADARKKALRVLAENNPALLKLFDEMDQKAKEGGK